MGTHLQVIVLVLEDAGREAGEGEGELAAIQGLGLHFHLRGPLQPHAHQQLHSLSKD